MTGTNKEKQFSYRLSFLFLFSKQRKNENIKYRAL